MKINKIISIVLALEFVYALYKIIPTFLMSFDSSQPVPYIIVFLILILLLISAIGIFFNKKWAVIALWVFIALPLIGRVVVPFVTFIGGYYFVIVNVIAATYLSMTFSKKKENEQTAQ